MHVPDDTNTPHTDTHKVVLIYAVFASLWIVLSDRALDWFFDDPTIIDVAQTLKGWFFVGVTSTLLYFLLRKPGSTPYRDIPSKQHTWLVSWKRWQLYLLAVVSTLMTLMLRHQITASLGERPLLILFMLPITLSAAIGGFGPGLVATLISALSAIFFALPAIGSFKIEYSYDLLQLGFLIVNGLLVSFLSMMLHEASQRSDSERKNAESNLAEKSLALQLLEGIAEGSTDAIYAKDLQGRYLMFNQAAARYVDKTAREVLGKDDTTFFPPEQVALIQNNDRQVMLDDQVVTFHENLNTENGMVYFLATKGPLHDEAGKVIGLFGISRNITERKQAEDELQGRNEELERFNKATVGRELDMITLKKQINELSSRLGQEPPYPLNFLDEHAKTPKGGETL